MLKPHFVTVLLTQPLASQNFRHQLTNYQIKRILSTGSMCFDRKPSTEQEQKVVNHEERRGSFSFHRIVIQLFIHSLKLIVHTKCSSNVQTRITILVLFAFHVHTTDTFISFGRSSFWIHRKYSIHSCWGTTHNNEEEDADDDELEMRENKKKNVSGIAEVEHKSHTAKPPTNCHIVCHGVSPPLVTFGAQCSGKRVKETQNSSQLINWPGKIWTRLIEFI